MVVPIARSITLTNTRGCCDLQSKSSEVLRSYVVYILEQRLNDPSVCDMDELRSCVQILTNKGPLNPAETPIHFTPKYGNAIDLARQLSSKPFISNFPVACYSYHEPCIFLPCSFTSSSLKESCHFLPAVAVPFNFAVFVGVVHCWFIVQSCIR